MLSQAFALLVLLIYRNKLPPFESFPPGCEPGGHGRADEVFTTQFYGRLQSCGRSWSGLHGVWNPCFNGYRALRLYNRAPILYKIYFQFLVFMRVFPALDLQL